MKDRYGWYGQGDHKHKDWFIYDHKNNCLLAGYKFKTKREAMQKATDLNENDISALKWWYKG